MHHLTLPLSVQWLAVNHSLLSAKEQYASIGIDFEACDLFPYVLHDEFFDKANIKLTVFNADSINIDLGVLARNLTYLVMKGNKHGELLILRMDLH